MSSSAEEIKNQIVSNQGMIDRLNAELARKTQEVHIIQEISSEINATLDLDVVLNKMLTSLDQIFDFKHSMVLLPDKNQQILKVAAIHGFEGKGLGAEVPMGEGMIGVVAKRKKLMRMGNIGVQMAYMNSVKNKIGKKGKENKGNTKLPGLDNVQSQVAIPMLSENHLVGVLAVESSKPNLFNQKDELIISILAEQAASAIEKAKAHQELKKINENLEAIVKQRTTEIVEQKEIIEEKNKSITDSIHYAKTIQNAILPSTSYLNRQLNEYFIIYQPKDIVSGDFYWVNGKEDSCFVSVVDCTGHGVPGAFMSIVAHNNLQRSLNLFNLRETAEILDKINESVIEFFKKEDQPEIKDGMDMVLCKFDFNAMEMEFSGANNPVFLIRNEELIILKGDKQPIGNFSNRKSFTSQRIGLQKNDLVYLVSDGYADQFGGPDKKTRTSGGKKFKSGKLKNLFLEISSLSMNEQKEKLEQAFNSWKGELEQVDDVTMIGIRI